MKRAGQRIVSVCIGACALAFGAHGHADPSASEAPAVSAERSGDSALDESGAAAAYRRARLAYEAGDPHGAFDGMRESYLLSGRAELLFNIARLERELGRCRAANTDYKSYLERAPNGKYRSSAEQASRELEVECGLPESGPRPSVTLQKSNAPAPSKQRLKHVRRSYWTNERVLGWSFISAGALAAGGATYFVFAQRNAVHQSAQNIAREEAGGPRSDSAIQARQDQYRTLAEVLAVTSGAFVFGGAVALLMSPRDLESGASATLSFQPGLVHAGCTLRF